MSSHPTHRWTRGACAEFERPSWTGANALGVGLRDQACSVLGQQQPLSARAPLTNAKRAEMIRAAEAAE